MSISDAFRLHEDIKNAQREEPALKNQWENERRGVLLEQIRKRAGEGGEEYAPALSLAKNMRSNSVAGAWDTLAIELARIEDKECAQAALQEGQLVRVEVWRAMEGDKDVISQLVPLGNRFLAVYSEGIMDFRRMLGTMVAYMGPLRLDGEMGDHVVNMARFGSGADDWMVRIVIGELYLERGLFEEALGICERMIRFKGNDRARMLGSTLIEQTLNSVLGHLHRCEEPGHVDYMVGRGMPISPRCRDDKYLKRLKRRCLSLLRRRARSLGLRIKPDPKENNTLRKASDFAQDVQARRQVHKAEDIVAHIRERYPESYAFLGLASQRTVRNMAKKQVFLFQNISTQIEIQRIAKARNMDSDSRTALDWLEPMLKFRKARKMGDGEGAMKKWKEGMRGDQLWDFLFEMDVYLRLVRVGADVKADIKIPKIGEEGMAEIDLMVDGCLAEVFAPLDNEVFVDSHVTSIEDPGTRLMDDVLGKRQLRHVDKRMAMMIVKCSGGDYGNVLALGTKLKLQLRAAAQPGAVFFVSQNDDRYNVTCLVNPKAAARIPKQTIRTVQEALALDML